MKVYRGLLGLGFYVAFITSAQAICDVKKDLNTDNNNYAIQLELPNFNISNLHLQPVGTILGSTIVPPKPPPHMINGITLETVIWTCDLVDKDNIFFLVSTNGRSTFNGHQEVGQSLRGEDVYSTFWKYVGLKLSVNGVVVSRLYSAVPLTNTVEVDEVAQKVHIRLRDLPPVEATVYRVDNLPVSTGGSTVGCVEQADWGKYVTGYVEESATKTRTVSCDQPSMYIQLAGNSKVYARNFDFDQVGQDSATTSKFRYKNGFSYGFLNSATYAYRSPACVARSVTPEIDFQAVNLGSLSSGETFSKEFIVQLECNDEGVVSGTEAGQFAIGFQPSVGGYDAAQALNLTNPNGSVNYLLSDNYNDPNSAKGVGIQLKNTANNKDMIFVNKTGMPGGGEAAGWYPVFDGTPNVSGSNTVGYNYVSQRYTAILKAIPGIGVQGGEVNATATVLVQIQ